MANACENCQPDELCSLSHGASRQEEFKTRARNKKSLQGLTQEGDSVFHQESQKVSMAKSVTHTRQCVIILTIFRHRKQANLWKRRSCKVSLSAPFVRLCMYVCMYVCTELYVYAYVYMICVYLYLCMYVCICLYSLRMYLFLYK